MCRAFILARSATDARCFVYYVYESAHSVIYDFQYIVFAFLQAFPATCAVKREKPYFKILCFHLGYYLFLFLCYKISRCLKQKQYKIGELRVIFGVLKYEYGETVTVSFIMKSHPWDMPLHISCILHITFYLPDICYPPYHLNRH